MIGFLAFALPFAFYLRWPSCFWNFDGVACAAALELGNPVYFFHSNHLLYGFLGFVFWKALLAPIGLHRALPALQIFTPALSCLALVGLYRLLTVVLDGQRVTALLLSTAMGLTAVVWVWSVEAQVYALGFLGLSWATVVLVARQDTKRYRWVGFLHAFAILGHLMHVLWIVPAGYWILNEGFTRRENRAHFREYLLWMTGTTIAAYALVYALILRPAHLSSTAMMNWLKGSAGLTMDRHWAWHHSSGFAPFHWLHSTAAFFWGPFWPYADAGSPAILWTLTGISMALVLGLIALSFRSSSQTLAKDDYVASIRWFSWAWIAVYGLFLWSWEPATLCYRMTEAVPFGLLLALGLRTITPSKLAITLASGLLGSLMLLTLITRIKPMSDSARNATYVETMEVIRQTPPESFYLTKGGLPWIYLLYFSGRTAWDVDHVAPENVRNEILSRRHHSPVYLREDVFNQGKAIPWIVLERWTFLEHLPWRRLDS